MPPSKFQLTRNLPTGILIEQIFEIKLSVDFMSAVCVYIYMFIWTLENVYNHSTDHSNTVKNSAWH